jgi:divalent metal cation (Fe/Co/Zn/Cd) transporter
MSKKKVATMAIFGGMIIFAVKLYSWSISGSVALLSDALESVVNILASIMMSSSVWISENPLMKTIDMGIKKWKIFQVSLKVC